MHKAMAGIAISALIMLGVTTGSSADTFKLTVAAGQPPRPLLSLAKVRDFFIPEVNRRIKAAGIEHEIEWKQAYAGSLLKPRKVFIGVKDGIADIGYVPLIFHPDKVPLELVSFMTPFSTTDLSIVTRAMAKLHATIPEMKEQYDKFNQVRLGGSGVDSFQLFTKFPVRTVADMKGRKIGTAGAALLWLRGIGVTPVSSNMMEYYNSTKTGVYEGFIVMGSTIPGMKYPEAAPYVTKADFGAPYVVGLTMNKDSLKRLPESIQKIILEVGEEWGKVSDKAYMTAGERGLSLAPKFNGTVSSLPVSEQIKWAENMPNIAKEWADRLDKKGLPGTKILNTYMEEIRALGAKPHRNWDKN